MPFRAEGNNKIRPEGHKPSGQILLFPSARSIGQTLFQNFFKKVVFGG